MQGDVKLLFAQLLKSSQALCDFMYLGGDMTKIMRTRMRRLIDLMRILELLNKVNSGKLMPQI